MSAENLAVKQKILDYLSEHPKSNICAITEAVCPEITKECPECRCKKYIYMFGVTENMRIVGQLTGKVKNDNYVYSIKKKPKDLKPLQDAIIMHLAKYPMSSSISVAKSMSICDDNMTDEKKCKKWNEIISIMQHMHSDGKLETKQVGQDYLYYIKPQEEEEEKQQKEPSGFMRTRLIELQKFLDDNEPVLQILENEIMRQVEEGLKKDICAGRIPKLTQRYYLTTFLSGPVADKFTRPVPQHLKRDVATNLVIRLANRLHKEGIYADWEIKDDIELIVRGLAY